jgi:hypothetical protein
VIAYGDEVLDEVPFVVHEPPSLVLTCTTTLAIAAVGALVPVYDASDAVERVNAGVSVPTIPSEDDDPLSVSRVRVPTVGAVVSTVIRPFVVERADVTVFVAKSVTSARTEYVVPLTRAGDAVTVYAVPPLAGAVNVALSSQVVPPLELTCSRTDEIPVAFDPLPV